MTDDQQQQQGLSNRIETIMDALDVRSDERVVVLADGDRRERYPYEWEKPDSLRDARIGNDSVVLIDRLDLGTKALATIVSRGPRLTGVICSSREHRDSMRKRMVSLYPFAEIWELRPSWGDMLVWSAKGAPYSRDRIVDMRGGSPA